MMRHVIIVCEGRSEASYLRALQRFVENELPLASNEEDPRLRFVVLPDESSGVETGSFDKIFSAYKATQDEYATELVHVWVDADIYIRNEPLPSNLSKHNGTEYLSEVSKVLEFKFSYYNFEDFIALHYDEADFQKWKTQVLHCRLEGMNKSHFEQPLSRKVYMPLFHKFSRNYSKGKTPVQFSKESFANLRRNLEDPDVIAMGGRLLPGINFGKFLLGIFDDVYPEFIS